MPHHGSGTEREEIIMTGQDLLYLSRADVERIALPMEEIIASLERMFLMKSRGEVEMPPKPGIHTRKDAFLHAMPAYIPDLGAAGIKWVGGYPENHAKGIPYITGLMVLNDPDTGCPLAVMDCTWVTAKRTGAATAVAAKRLAREDAASVGILGCGVQGESNLEALLCVRPGIRTVYAYDVRGEQADRYVAKVKAAYPGLDVAKVPDPRSAVTDSDIVVTAGPILLHPSPVIEASWFRKGAFASPVDFDSYWKPEALHAADLFCTDDADQLAYYRRAGYFQDIPTLHGEVGDLVAGKIRGRTDATERTMSMNLGIALEDMATGIVLLDRAIRLGVGTRLPL
jgi:ornithine cyclodeaminase/alanine dehydrogenase-like protein (mu-crystallin family)